MNQKSKIIRKIGQFVAVFAIAVIFFSLGVWQLDRAADLKDSLKVATSIDTRVVKLQTVATPRQALQEKAVNRTVLLSGRYIEFFKAPNQMDGFGQVSDWEVGLLEVDLNSAILVVRGLWSDRLLKPEIQEPNTIDIEGVMVAHQNGDRAQNGPGVISRLDSAVVVSLTKLDLYDGYVLANKETLKGQSIIRSRVTHEPPNSRIPGYYWQHISYVAIWWLMAAIVLYMPFYRRRVMP